MTKMEWCCCCGKTGDTLEELVNHNKKNEHLKEEKNPWAQ